MSILILGGRGYLGSELTETLKNKKIKYYSPNKKQLNLINSQKILDFCIKKKIKLIVNLAGISKVKKDLEKKYIRENFLAVEKLLNKLSEKNFSGKFIHMSSAYVYPANLNKKITENTDAKPENYYSYSKVLADNSIIYHSKKINCTSIRMPNCIGGIQYKNYLIPSLIDQINDKRQNKILIKNGKTKRNFVDIRDFCRFIIFLYRYKKKIYPIINFCSNKNYSIAFLAKILKRTFSSNKIISADTKKIKKSDYNFKPFLIKKIRFNFRYNIKETINYLNKKYESQKNK